MNIYEKIQKLIDSGKINTQMIQAMSMTYMLGVSIGELYNLGFTKEEIKEICFSSLNSLK